MKLKHKIQIALAGLGMLMLPTGANAQEAKQPVPKPAIVAEANTDWKSKYIFRGFEMSQHPVVQNTVVVNYGRVTAIGFNNFDSGKKASTETDVFIEYAMPWNKHTITVGYGTIGFPNIDVPNTQEAYVRADFDAPLKPSLTYVRDFGSIKGGYATLGVKQELKVGKFPMTLTAIVAHNDQYLRSESGLSHLELGLSADVPLGKDASLRPSITYIKPLCEGFKEQVQYGIGLNIKL